MRIRRRVCKICNAVRRRLLRATLCNVLWVLCALFSVYVLVTYIAETTEYSNERYEKNIKQEQNKQIKKTKLKFHRNPAIVWWNQGYRLDEETIECQNGIKCDAFSPRYILPNDSDGAYLFYASRLEFDDLPLPRNPKKVLWALSHEESPKNIAELLYEPALNLFNISSTFSRYSDVPFPLQAMESIEDITSTKSFVATSEKNRLLKEIAPVLYMNSNCFTLSDRDEYVKELMKHIPVDSYGACLNNKKWPDDFPSDYLNNLYDDKVLDFIARYKFVIAIENGVCEDYITEKLWRPIKVGVVPIYFGSPSVRDWLPNNSSAILTSDYLSPKLLSEHLYMLLDDDSQYEEYLEHKIKGLISNRRIFNELETRPYQTDVLKTKKEFECYVCKKLHANIANPTAKIVTKRHYDCPRPISALTGKSTDEVFYNYAKRQADHLYKRVLRDSLLPQT